MTDQVPTLADLYQAKKDVKDINTFTKSPNRTFVDSDGFTKLTLAGIVAAGGYYPVNGSFETGGTLTDRNQVLLRSASPAAFFSWGGALPKVVPAGSTVAGTGGESVNGWTNRNDGTFKTSLAAVDSTDLVGGVEAGKTIVPVMHLKALPVSGLVNGRQYQASGFYSGSTVGGGLFVWDATRSKSGHNGGTVIAPEALTAWNGTHAGLSTYLNWSGSGNGCFVRVKKSHIYPENFGAVGDATLYDDTPLKKHADTMKFSKITWKSGSNYLLSRQLEILVNSDLVFEGNNAKFKTDANYAVSTSGDWRPAISVIGQDVKVTVRNLYHYGSNDILNWITAVTNFGVHSVSVAGQINGVRLSKVNVENITSDFAAGSTVRVARANRVSVSNCTGNKCGFHGIEFNNCDKVFANKNMMNGVGAAGGNALTGVQGGIGILATLCNEVNITNNIIEQMTDTCSKTEGCSRVVYSSNQGRDCGKDGFKVQGYPGEPGQSEFAIIKGNIMINLYDWRTDGSNLFAVHNTRRVIFNGNIGHSDPVVTGAGPKRGIVLMNLPGAIGSSGTISVTNNIIGKTFEPDPTGTLYGPSEGLSITLLRTGTSGRNMIVSNNICFGAIHAGGGFGRTIVNGNMVGADYDSGSAALISGGNRAGIMATGAEVIVSNNTVIGHGKGVAITQFNPEYSHSTISVSGNIIRGCPSNLVDISISTAPSSLGGVTPRIISVSINNNTMNEITCGNKPAIRIRPNGQIINASISSNTLQGDYATLLEIFERLEADPLLGHFVVTANSEQSVRENYYISSLLDHCERVTGDYATISNTIPPSTGRKYLRGDIVWNRAILSGRPMGWMMALPATQTWVAMPNAVNA